MDYDELPDDLDEDDIEPVYKPDNPGCLYMLVVIVILLIVTIILGKIGCVHGEPF